MRFLFISKSKFPFPPEAALGLVDAMAAFVNKYRENGKLEQVWSLAQGKGGGAIINVNSLEELSSILGEFPFGPFTEDEVYPLIDIDAGLKQTKQAIQAAMSQQR